MNFDQLNKLLEEEKITGIRASSLNLEIKNKIKEILQMDRYKNLSKTAILNTFMKKFNRYIKQNNLRKSEIKELAKIEIERQLQK